MRALVVDDSKAMRMIVGRTLRHLGAEVVEAPDGEQALACLRGGARVDAVFVDWNMPVMDGLSFVKTVRADSAFDAVRIVMVTTEAESDRVEAAMAAGANEYVMKPFTEEMMRRKLESLGLRR